MDIYTNYTHRTYQEYIKISKIIDSCQLINHLYPTDKIVSLFKERNAYRIEKLLNIKWYKIIRNYKYIQFCALCENELIEALQYKANEIKESSQEQPRPNYFRKKIKSLADYGID